MWTRPFHVSFLSLAIVGVAGSAWALERFGVSDTSSPRATLVSFINACNRFHDVAELDRYLDRDGPRIRPLGLQIIDCLDTSELPEFVREARGGEVAGCLKEILDRVEVDLDDAPDLEDIEAAGGPERLSRYQLPGTRLTIARVESGPQRHEYLFTAGTVARAKQYYEDVAHLPYRTTGPKTSPGLLRWYYSAPSGPWIGAIVDRLPDWAHQRFLGLVVWKWMGLIPSILAALALMVAAYVGHRHLVHRYRETSLLLYWLSLGLPILAMCVPLALRHVGAAHLAIRGTPLYVLSFSTNLVALLASFGVVFGFSARIGESLISAPHINPAGLDAQFIRIICRILGLLTVVIVFLEGGQHLGIPLTTLLASAGVGGLALALAAQDTLRNLLGTITLMADRPFRVGERIVFGKYDGVVEDVGLRSTRIRLLGGHLVSIPNDELARNDIENVGRRPFIRRVANIRLPLTTPPDLLEAAVGVVRDALENHEGMSPDHPPRVYFDEFNPDSFNVKMIYWYSPPDYWDYLAFGERLNARICGEFQRLGIPFAVPLRIARTSLDGRESADAGDRGGVGSELANEVP